MISLRFLKKLVNCLYDIEFNSFKHAYINLAFKKSDPTGTKNYRPISLFNVDSKIVRKVYASRISAALLKLLEPMQYAFNGRNVSNGLMLLRDVINLT